MKKLLLPIATLMLFLASCTKESVQQEQPNALDAKGSSKIKICHYNLATRKWSTIEISTTAWADHKLHGDVRLDDQDGDGYVPTNSCGFMGTKGMGDCNDTNAAINPGAAEICGDGIDNNCNSQIDEKCIPSVTICDQVWMQKNLDVTTYRNGDAIPQVTDPTQWGNLTTGAWCYYNNDPANGPIYGKLYNWYAVNDVRGLAPTGYHVPSEAEWTTLVTCLGGSSVAGGAMKEIGTTHWLSPNTGATNSSGFAGLPGAGRGFDGAFNYIGDTGYWWSSTEGNTTDAWCLFLYYFDSNVYSANGIKKLLGFSVRCLRD